MHAVTLIHIHTHAHTQMSVDARMAFVFKCHTSALPTASQSVSHPHKCSQLIHWIIYDKANNKKKTLSLGRLYYNLIVLRPIPKASTVSCSTLLRQRRRRAEPWASLQELIVCSAEVSSVRLIPSERMIGSAHCQKTDIYSLCSGASLASLGASAVVSTYSPTRFLGPEVCFMGVRPERSDSIDRIDYKMMLSTIDVE